MAETLPGLEGFDRRHASDVYPVTDRARQAIAEARALVQTESPLAWPMIEPRLAELERDVKMLESFYVGAANDLERLWPFLPSGMDED